MVIIDQVQGTEPILELLSAFDECFPRPISARVGDLRQHAQKLADHAIVQAAKQDGVAAGFVAFYANDAKTSVAFLTHLAVAAPFRGQGIGLMLLRGCLARSKEAGMTTMTLEVDADNKPAIAFYSAHGFTLAGPASSASCFMVREAL